MKTPSPMRTVVLEAFGRRLHHLRAAYGEKLRHPNLSPGAFARMLEIETERYRTWEAGTREMPLWMLVKMKNLIGVSIDVLLDGATTLPQNELFAPDVAAYEQMLAMAQRIRWVRRMKEPNIEEVARVMRVPVELWQNYELGLQRPDLGRLAEFAGRFRVSLDFLWSGRLIGIEPGFLQALLDTHPSLRPPGYVSGDFHYSGTATEDGDTTDPKSRIVA